MARALGMNPKKLPGLRPSPHQHWKLPVSEFIEACYRKRFGNPRLDDPSKPAPARASFKLQTTQMDVNTQKQVTDATSQLEDLVCYLINLAHDLEARLAQRTVTREVLQQVVHELREIAEALEAGAPVSPIPSIPQSRRSASHTSSRRGNWECTFNEEIPF